MEENGSPGIDPERLELLQRWRPSKFGVVRAAGRPPVERWEELLRAERSAAHQLVLLAARMPGLRRLLCVPAHLGRPEQVSLEEREARVAEIGEIPLSRFLDRVGSSPRQAPARPAPPGERPAIGSFLDHEIDAALTLLKDIPFEELQERGWHVQPNQYSWPLNDVPFLRANANLWLRSTVPEGIEWDLDGQERLARSLGRSAGELSDVPEGKARRAGEFVWGNGGFDGDDARAYYGLVRELRPRRVVEVGSGWSTLVLARALARNEQPAEVTLIDPGPDRAVLGALPPDWRLVPSLVQWAGREVFEALEPGDLLLYDGSHCMRTGSDVNWMLFEVLPRLSPGVWVHFHDIFWRNDYPIPWVIDEGLSFNEQYALHAFLLHNEAFRVRLAVNMLLADRGFRVGEPGSPTAGGGSLWLERIA